MTPMQRFLAAHAFATASRGGQALPDVFAGTVFIVDEIAAAVETARAVVVELRVARSTRALDAMESANAELGKLLSQASTLQQSLATVLAKHQRTAAQGGDAP